MRININPTTIAEAILLLEGEELLTNVKETLDVLAKAYDIEDDGSVEYFYFHDNSSIVRGDDGKMESRR